MKRREFFKLGARKVTEAALEVTSQVLSERPANCLRPPYALAEPDFLIACSRCDDCLKACPHEVIFKLGPKLGERLENTPALDLLRLGCRMCDDLPCVAACGEGALLLPEAVDDQPIPAMALARISLNTKTCLPYAGPECGACAGSCPVPGALDWQGTRPVINQDLCSGCAMCREACITDPKSIDIAVLA